MKKRYDFSKGIRGKFYRPNLVLSIPIYLDAKLQKRVEEIARRKGQDMGAVVSCIVRKELALLADMKWEGQVRIRS
jgi:hypothetical protein